MGTSGKDRPQDRLIVVDALRGVAALMVLIGHLPKATGVLSPLRQLQATGHTGVGLFLVLSGFSIHFRWAQRRGEGAFDTKKFWRRRFFRLYPTYIAAALVSLAIAAALGDLGQPDWPFADTEEPLAVLVAVQVTLVTGNLLALPVVGVAWSLALEVQLYAAYTLIAKRLRRIGVWKIVICSLILSLLWRVAAEWVVTSVPVAQSLPDGSHSSESQLFYSQLPARWFEWMLGVAIAEIYWGNLKRPRARVSLPVAVIGLLLATFLFRRQQGGLELNGHPFHASDVLIDPLFGVAYGALLLFLLSGRANRAMWLLRPLAFVGLFSYSLYLLHLPLVEVTDEILPASSPAALREVALASVAIVGSWLFFLAVERRFLFPGRRTPKQVVAPAAGVGS